MKNILRVFPYRTSYTPDDEMVIISHPKMKEVEGQEQMEDFFIIPPHDEIHISCTFTWDKKDCIKLQRLYMEETKQPVKFGGPAFGSEATDFIQGLYLKQNIIFTSRGCNNNCPWCNVPKLEGKLKELPICQGNIIQDNNFLQTSRLHKEKVFDMLRTQKQICFKGGLETDLIDDHFCDALQSLYYIIKNGKKVSRIKELWLACDTDGALPRLKKACEKLTKIGFDRNKINCYCLIGDDMDKNENRLRQVYEAGAMPRAQLYRDFSDIKTEYSVDWNKFARMWSRPAATKAHMEKGTHYNNFNT